MTFARLLSGTLLLLLPGLSYGQWYLYGGPNVDQVRAPTLRGDIRPKYGFEIGGQRTIPDWTVRERLLPMARVRLLHQGYRQALAGQTYRISFTYFTLSPGATYRLSDFVTVNTTLDINLLMSARYRVVGDTSTIGVADTYRSTGLALRGELVLWSEASVSPYLSLSHALRTALRYPRIDAVGNFHGNIRDIWHRTLTIGLRIQL